MEIITNSPESSKGNAPLRSSRKSKEKNTTPNQGEPNKINEQLQQANRSLHRQMSDYRK